MTMPVTLERTVRVGWRRRFAARLAVCVARLLVRLPAGRLRRVLCVVRVGARAATTSEARAARDAVVSVSVRCAGQGCLQRSVATALLCRANNVWPDWCVGVRTEPFRAHAWVAVGGAPVGERDEVRAYHAIVTVPARPRRAERLR